MGRRLQEVKNERGQRLQKNEEEFRIAIEEKLENGFEIKDMDKSDVDNLHRFINETVGKRMSISQVDHRYLRKKDSNLNDAGGKNIIHYGHDGSTFRVFGYYNNAGYFVLTRIDGKHKTHRD